MKAAIFSLMETELHLLPDGAVFIPQTGTLVVADLHLEKGSSRRESGLLLPPWGSSLTIERLSTIITEIQPRRLIALGDSFHDNTAWERLLPEDRKHLKEITQATETFWIAGNHDEQSPEGLDGQWHNERRENAFLFRHIPDPHIPSGLAEIAGHLHPKVRLTGRGHTLSRRCFVVDDRRLILPAFGTYTGGLTVSTPAFRQIFPNGHNCFALGKDRVYQCASTS